MLEKISNWYKGLPDKKRYVEFVTALLTVPVLLTVLMSNINNLSNKPVPKEQTKPTVVTQVVEKISPEVKSETTKSAETCKKEIGPVEIVYPSENETITKNPVCVDISTQKQNYCSSVWSYRINDGNWSDYTDKSICLYNLDSGDKKLELRVKSIASDDEKIIERNFIYKNNNPVPTPTPTQSATTSATLK